MYWNTEAVVAYFDTITIFAWKDRKFNTAASIVPTALLSQVQISFPEASVQAGISRGFRYFAHANTGNYVMATSWYVLSNSWHTNHSIIRRCIIRVSERTVK
jgi:hypothetical protein